MQAPDILAVLDRPDEHVIALQDSRCSMSYAQLGPSVRALAGALIRRGVAPGDRVAVMLPNSIDCVQMYLACALSGAVWMGLNLAAPQAERDRQCDLLRPTLIVTATGAPHPFAASRAVELHELVDDDAPPFDGTPPDPALPSAIGFSSGTTGTPKAVVHNRQAVSLTASVLAGVQLRSDDRVGVILPMSIHNLLVVGALPALFVGATCVPVERMSATGVAAACTDMRLTTLNALVPATIYDLVHDEAIGAQALSALRTAGTGAAGLSDDLRSSFEAKFGVRLVGSYGMTEAPGVVCIEDPSVAHIEGASGRPLPHLRVEAHDERGRPLPPHADGELVVSPATTGPWAGLYRPALGTWTDGGLQLRDPDETHLRTGDRGWVDTDGTVHVTGRQADVIVRGGVNINAAEVESVLGQLTDVRAVAVIGEPDDRLGQRIVAFVEPREGATVSASTLRQRARELLSHGKVPDEFVIAVLPRNAMGKIARAQLMRPKTDDRASAL